MGIERYTMTLLLGIILGIVLTVAAMLLLPDLFDSKNDLSGKPVQVAAASFHAECFGCHEPIWIEIVAGDIKGFLVASLNEHLCKSCEGKLHNG